MDTRRSAKKKRLDTPSDNAVNGSTTNSAQRKQGSEANSKSASQTKKPKLPLLRSVPAPRRTTSRNTTPSRNDVTKTPESKVAPVPRKTSSNPPKEKNHLKTTRTLRPPFRPVHLAPNDSKNSPKPNASAPSPNARHEKVVIQERPKPILDPKVAAVIAQMKAAKEKKQLTAAMNSAQLCKGRQVLPLPKNDPIGNPSRKQVKGTGLKNPRRLSSARNPARKATPRKESTRKASIPNAKSPGKTRASGNRGKQVSKTPPQTRPKLRKKVSLSSEDYTGNRAKKVSKNPVQRRPKLRKKVSLSSDDYDSESSVRSTQKNKDISTRKTYESKSQVTDSKKKAKTPTAALKKGKKKVGHSALSSDEYSSDNAPRDSNDSSTDSGESTSDSNSDYHHSGACKQVGKTELSNEGCLLPTNIRHSKQTRLASGDGNERTKTNKDKGTPSRDERKTRTSAPQSVAVKSVAGKSVAGKPFPSRISESSSSAPGSDNESESNSSRSSGSSSSTSSSDHESETSSGNARKSYARKSYARKSYARKSYAGKSVAVKSVAGKSFPSRISESSSSTPGSDNESESNSSRSSGSSSSTSSSDHESETSSGNARKSYAGKSLLVKPPTRSSRFKTSRSGSGNRIELNSDGDRNHDTCKSVAVKSVAVKSVAVKSIAVKSVAGKSVAGKPFPSRISESSSSTPGSDNESESNSSRSSGSSSSTSSSDHESETSSGNARKSYAGKSLLVKPQAKISESNTSTPRNDNECESNSARNSGSRSSTPSSDNESETNPDSDRNMNARKPFAGKSTPTGSVSEADTPGSENDHDLSPVRLKNTRMSTMNPSQHRGMESGVGNASESQEESEDNCCSPKASDSNKQATNSSPDPDYSPDVVRKSAAIEMDDEFKKLDQYANRRSLIRAYCSKQLSDKKKKGYIASVRQEFFLEMEYHLYLQRRLRGETDGYIREMLLKAMRSFHKNTIPLRIEGLRSLGCTLEQKNYASWKRVFEAKKIALEKRNDPTWQANFECVADSMQRKFPHSLKKEMTMALNCEQFKFLKENWKLLKEVLDLVDGCCSELFLFQDEGAGCQLQ